MSEVSTTHLPAASPDLVIYEEMHESLLALAGRWLADPETDCPVAPQFDLAWDRATAAISAADPSDVVWEAARLGFILASSCAGRSPAILEEVGTRLAERYAPRRRRLGHLSLV